LCNGAGSAEQQGHRDKKDALRNKMWHPTGWTDFHQQKILCEILALTEIRNTFGITKSDTFYAKHLFEIEGRYFFGNRATAAAT